MKQIACKHETFSQVFEAFYNWPGRGNYVEIRWQGHDLRTSLNEGNTLFVSGSNGHNSAKIDIENLTLASGEKVNLSAEIRVTKTNVPGTFATFGGYSFNVTLVSTGQVIQTSHGFVEYTSTPVFVSVS